MDERGRWRNILVEQKSVWEDQETDVTKIFKMAENRFSLEATMERFQLFGGSLWRCVNEGRLLAKDKQQGVKAYA